MALKIAYVLGNTLDKSYFVGTDEGEKGREVVVRATSVIPQSLHKMAAANKLKTEPEDYIADLTKLCTSLDDFEHITAEIAAGARELKVEAKEKGDAPVTATEPVPAQKKLDEPVVAAEESYTQKPKDMTAAPDTKAFYNRLPTKVPGSPEIALDVNSSDKDGVIKALAEQVDQLKGQLEQKHKEDELEEVLELLQDIGVDAKEIEKLKKEMASLPEAAIGVLESALGAAAKKVHGDKGGSKPPAEKKEGEKGEKKGGMPEGMAAPFGGGEKKAASDDFTASRNITAAIVEETGFGGDSNALTTKWLAVNEGRA